jgi:hypothetical protein
METLGLTQKIMAKCHKSPATGQVGLAKRED